MSVDGEATVDGKSVDVLPIDAMKLVHTVASNFRKPQMLDDYLVDDNLDGWAITISNDDGQSWIFEGDFGEALLVGQHNLSDLIRTTLEKDVWAFDGNTQDIKITKVALSYFGDNPDEHTE